MSNWASAILLVGVMVFLLLIWLTLCMVYARLGELLTAAKENRIELIRNRTMQPPVSLRIAQTPPDSEV